MANDNISGIDVRASGGKLLIDVYWEDENGPITTGTSTVMIGEAQDTGQFLTYDDSDKTFKATSAGTPTVSLTHRQWDNNTYDTGIWSAVLSDLSGFTPRATYRFIFEHSSGLKQVWRWQFGGAEGDLLVSNGGVDVQTIEGQDATDALEALLANNSVVLDKYTRAQLYGLTEVTPAGGGNTLVTYMEDDGTTPAFDVTVSPASERIARNLY